MTNPSSNVDILIVGQGICGTFLSWYLQKAGIDFTVIDEAVPRSASKAAAGIINPVTGRRIVKTWMIDELMPFAWNVYREIGDELGIECIAKKNIIDFFPGPQMRLAFLDRQAEGLEYLSAPDDQAAWQKWIIYDFGFAMISPAYLADTTGLLAAWRKNLVERKLLSDERFQFEELTITTEHIRYRNLTARKIIFCDGIGGCDNPFFKNLPFAPNKGEALMVEIKDLPNDHIYKKGLTLAPISKELFWFGSTYEWDFQNPDPTPAFREKSEAMLQQFIKVPFKIVDHIASIRPATMERRPFAGFHPVRENVGILNGMGAKGCSLAPYFANQLARNIIDGTALIPEADVRRFKKILTR